MDQHPARSLGAADSVGDAGFPARCKSLDVAGAPGGFPHCVRAPGPARSWSEHVPQDTRIVAGSVEN
jgi:hypothetical protein